MTPRKLSHFELLDELGAGGMGVVFRARDLKLNRLVAVKVLPDAAQGDRERRRFLAEAQAASGINHPSVVTIYEVGSDGGTDFIAMELVAGRSLASELARGALPISRALRLGIAILDGLEAAHRVGLVHRDLKPGNLMIGPDDRIKILDFGLVKRVAATGNIVADAPTAIAPESLTASGLLLGTPAYMSPEQARGQAVDVRSDLFSFGCVLYEMVTGRRAFSGENSIQVLSGILSGEPEPAPGLPPELAAILERLLAKGRDLRPASAIAARRELEALAATGSDAPTVTSALAPAPDRRAVALLAGVATLVAGIAALATFLLTRATPAPDYSFHLLAQSTASERDAAFSADGNSVAFVREDEHLVPQIWIRSLAGGDSLQLTHGEVAAGSPEWSFAGDRIVFDRQNEGIWEVPPLGGTPRRLVDDGSRPRLSADGERLVFISHLRLWTAAGDGSDPQPVPGIEPAQYAFGAAAVFSPDGRWIAYFWPDRRRPLGDLWRVPGGGGTPERLTDLEFLAAGLDWSPDGRWIVFSSDHGGSRTLWRIPAAGGTPEPITRGAGEDSRPRLSRDGLRLVYTNQRNLHVIERLDPASGRRQRVHERRIAPYMPALSADGNRVVFFSRVPDATHLFVVPIEGGHEEQVTFGSGRINSVARWSSDGRAIYYYADKGPEIGLRRLDLETRRDDAVMPGWEWFTRQWAAVSPGDREVAYLVRDADGKALETRIRNLASGEERALPVALLGHEWFADGVKLTGFTEAGVVQLCAVATLGCAPVAAGSYSRPSADGRWLYFLRFPGPVAWRLELASRREERLAELAGEIRTIAFGWGVRPNGELVWLRSEPDREELWLGDLH